MKRDEIEGLLLCHVGAYRLAIAATDVSSIGAWEVSDAPLPQARAAYLLPAAPGKLLMDEQAALVVDSIEVSADRFSMLPVPAMLLGAVGGALRGFVSIAGSLMPLLHLADFSKFVATLGPRA